MNHIFPGFKKTDLSGQNHLNARLECVFQIGEAPLEPLGGKGSAAVVDNDLKGPPPLIGPDFRLDNFTDYGLFDPNPCLTDLLHDPPVFVTSREKVKDVLDGFDAFPSEQLRDPWSHTPDELYIHGQLCYGLLQILHTVRRILLMFVEGMDGCSKTLPDFTQQ